MILAIFFRLCLRVGTINYIALLFHREIDVNLSVASVHSKLNTSLHCPSIVERRKNILLLGEHRIKHRVESQLDRSVPLLGATFDPSCDWANPPFWCFTSFSTP